MANKQSILIIPFVSHRSWKSYLRTTRTYPCTHKHSERTKERKKERMTTTATTITNRKWSISPLFVGFEKKTFEYSKEVTRFVLEMWINWVITITTRHMNKWREKWTKIYFFNDSCCASWLVCFYDVSLMATSIISHTSKSIPRLSTLFHSAHQWESCDHIYEKYD